jgi:tetratricopeptide (TPR) repeat protein
MFTSRVLIGEFYRKRRRRVDPSKVPQVPRNSFARSIEDFTAAIRLDPNNATAYLCRGTIYFHMKKFDQAIADCYATLKIEPDNSQAKFLLKIVRETKRGRLSILRLFFSFAVLVVFNLIFKNGG